MISINKVYLDEINEKRIRIIKVDEVLVYFVDIDSIVSLPEKITIKELENQILNKELTEILDPYSTAIVDCNLSDIQIKKREENWEFLNKYLFGNEEEVFAKKTRNNFLNNLSLNSGFSYSKVKKIISRYWQRGMCKNAVLPDYNKSGGKGKEKKLGKLKVGRQNSDGETNGINITDDIKILFSQGINKYYKNSKNNTLRDVYNFILRDYFSNSFYSDGELNHKVFDKNLIPTFRQFYYWFKKNENIKSNIITRKSDKEFNLKYRNLTGNSMMEVFGPGSKFQVDATVADIYLVSSIDRNRVIGRPVIYMIIDVFSRIVAGLYIGLEGPSWIGAMMALNNMVENKQEFCKKYDIDISYDEWPVHHLPDCILADRGEFEGYSVENIINNLNIRIENTPPYRGDLKGIVERRFRTINEKIKKMSPGAIQKQYRERGDLDYRLNAILNLKEFTQIIINLVLENNNQIIEKYPIKKEMIADKLVPTPLALWNWGISNRKGILKTINPDIMKLNVLPRGTGTITRVGIKFKNIYYGSQKAIEGEWYLKLKNRKINIVYDPRNMSKIYIPNDKGNDFEICSILQPSIEYKNEFLEDIEFAFYLEKENINKVKYRKTEERINRDALINEIIKNAEDKKAYNNSNNKKIKEIRQNRVFEKELQRDKEYFDLDKNNKITEESQVEDKGFCDDLDNFETKLLMDKIRSRKNDIRK